jgi:hypothetical protein
MLRPTDERFDPCDLRHHSSQMGPATQIAPVRGDAAAQIAGPSDVQSATPIVAEPVDTGLGRQERYR